MKFKLYLLYIFFLCVTSPLIKILKSDKEFWSQQLLYIIFPKLHKLYLCMRKARLLMCMSQLFTYQTCMIPTAATVCCHLQYLSYTLSLVMTHMCVHSRSGAIVFVVPLAFDVCPIHINHAPYCSSSKKRSPHSQRRASHMGTVK